MNRSHNPIDIDELTKDAEDDYDLISIQDLNLKTNQSMPPLVSQSSLQRAAGANQPPKKVKRPSIIMASISQFIQEELVVINSQIGDLEVEMKPIKAITSEEKSAWLQEKFLLIEQDEICGHAVEQSLYYKEQVVDKKLDKLRTQMLADDPTLITGNYYDKYQTLLKSPLYECLKQMPKPAVHHTHLTACADVNLLLELTYEEYVFYSEKEDLFYVNRKGCKLPGYLKVNTLRQYAQDASVFDDGLREKILLKPVVPEDHGIWKVFQPKFMLTNHLYNYADFFERILFKVSKSYIKEIVTVVEYRHIFGFLFNEEGPISLEQEIDIFYRTQKMLQVRFPLFKMKIIVCGLKIAGKGHIQLMLDNIEERQQDAWSMIAGFDMVNEEDYNAPIDEFLEQILTTKQKMGDNFQVILHAGESNSRDNKELYDAILLGSKRIGHGFAIAKHPKLIELVKEKNICLECCPVSNLVLGYTRDLRCHPARGLIAQGVKVSLSPDDQGFWDAKGVTMDYLMAYIAWDLDLTDLKQLVHNSLEFASIDEDHRKEVLNFATRKWIKFLRFVRGRH